MVFMLLLVLGRWSAKLIENQLLVLQQLGQRLPDVFVHLLEGLQLRHRGLRVPYGRREPAALCITAEMASMGLRILIVFCAIFWKAVVNSSLVALPTIAN